MKDLLQFKQDIYEYCMQTLQHSIETVENILKNLEESRNNESKSSAGDKYETGRAMLHLEEEKNKAQLAAVLLAKSVLLSIDLSKSYNKVEVGSFVITNNGKYFIAVGIGKILINKELIYAISLDSPIGQLLQNRKSGESFTFNGKVINIEHII